MNLQHTYQIDSNSLDRLKACDWPGNVRELQNIVERALLLSQGGRLIFPELNAVPKVLEDQKPIQPASDVMTIDQAMANHIRLVLEYTGGQVAGRGGAAELLQINESTLHFRMKKLGIRSKRT
jgi:transcriptional regulator of acetoin/glycerol metabolism